MESTKEVQGKSAREKPALKCEKEAESSTSTRVSLLTTVRSGSPESATLANEEQVVNGRKNNIATTTPVGVAKDEREGVVHPVVVRVPSIVSDHRALSLTSGIKIPIGSEAHHPPTGSSEVQVLKCECPSDNFLAHQPFYKSAFAPQVAYIISDGNQSRISHNSVTRITALNNGVGSVGSNSGVIPSVWSSETGDSANQNMSRDSQDHTRNNNITPTSVNENNLNNAHSHNHIHSAHTQSNAHNHRHALTPREQPNRIIAASKEQRRRERRERRARRQQHRNGPYADPYLHALYSAGVVPLDGSVPLEGIPEYLHSHLLPPPPYSTLPGRVARGGHPIAMRSVQPQAASPRLRGWRQTVLPAAAQDIGRSHFRHPPFFGDEDYRTGMSGGGSGKNCCGVHVTQTVSIRWFIVMIAFLGSCCSVVGTVLGALKASGRDHLTVSLLMIGVGIVLITVSGIAWRLTATDAPSCRALLGIGGPYEEDYTHGGRFLPRPPMGYNGPYSGGNGTTSGQPAAATAAAGRAQHPYAAMMYSDFNYRPPPPTYQASMQEYRLRLLLMDRPGVNGAGPGLAAANQSLSPPPQYRAQLRNALANAVVHSRPPSYQSQVSEEHQVIIPSMMGPVVPTNGGGSSQVPQSETREALERPSTPITAEGTSTTTTESPISIQGEPVPPGHGGGAAPTQHWSHSHRALIHHARMVSSGSVDGPTSVGVHHSLPVTHQPRSNSSTPKNSPRKSTLANNDDDPSAKIVPVGSDFIPSKTPRSSYGLKKGRLGPHIHHQHQSINHQHHVGHPNSSLVTIVSTSGGDSSESSASNAGDSVIVTVSGSIADSTTQHFRTSAGEVEILAHL